MTTIAESTVTTESEPTGPRSAEAQSVGPLSVRLRTATRPEHSEAEGTGFVEALIAGQLDADAYADLADQHLAIYTALERAGESLAGDPIAESFLFPELVRRPSLVADLAVLRGPAWPDRSRLLPATHEYVARIERVTAGAEAGLSPAGGYLAHAYTRYLGDLSGGQVIARKLSDHYGIGADGASFYRFAGVPKLKAFKDVFRARVDGAPWDESERLRVIDEVREAFRLNTMLFGQLGEVHCR